MLQDTEKDNRVNKFVEEKNNRIIEYNLIKLNKRETNRERRKMAEGQQKENLLNENQNKIG